MQSSARSYVCCTNWFQPRDTEIDHMENPQWGVAIRLSFDSEPISAFTYQLV